MAKGNPLPYIPDKKNEPLFYGWEILQSKRYARYVECLAPHLVKEQYTLNEIEKLIDKYWR